jgi:integrase
MFRPPPTTAATCDKYCDYRVKLIKAAQPDREGTRAVDLDLNTLSNAFQWAIRAELVKTNPLANRPHYHPASKVKHCRETMPRSADELHQLAAVFLNRRTNSAVLGWQTLAEGLTGLRTCEALGLRTDAPPYEPGWITPDGKSLCVRRAKGQQAVNPFCTVTDGLRLVLDAHAKWKKKHYPDSPWYFPSPDDPTVAEGNTALARALLRLGDVAIGHKGDGPRPARALRPPTALPRCHGCPDRSGIGASHGGVNCRKGIRGNPRQLVEWRWS